MQSEIGGDIYDAAESLSGNARAGESERAARMNGQNALPVVGQLPEHFVTEDSSVVDDNVDSAGVARST